MKIFITEIKTTPKKGKRYQIYKPINYTLMLGGWTLCGYGIHWGV